MSPATLSTLPEEIRQEITSHLKYNDAWSLKQTSTLFYRVVEIPTVKTFLARPCGPSLGKLEKGNVVPPGHEWCCYCHRLLPNERFSRFQRHLTAARQNSVCFDYASWKPEMHYCLECGVANRRHPLGRIIFLGFGDPGSRDEAVIPCEHCAVLIDYYPWDFRFCPDCHGIVLGDELSPLWIHDPRSALSGTGAEMADRGEGGVVEPERKDYENAGPGVLLALIGERLLS